jgi:hypothetical protein
MKYASPAAVATAKRIIESMPSSSCVNKLQSKLWLADIDFWRLPFVELLVAARPLCHRAGCSGVCPTSGRREG